MVSRKTTGVPPQDTKVIVDVSNLIINNGETYETSVFNTDGWGKICGSFVCIPPAPHPNDFDLEYRIYQGDVNASDVDSMDTYSNRDAGDKYHPETNGAGVAQDDCFVKNAWEITVVGVKSLVQIQNNTGAAITISRLQVNVRKT